MATEFEHFRVIIVGAGFAGLTLANALERAGIDYLLLEAARGQTDLNGAGLNAWPQGEGSQKLKLGQSTDLYWE